MRNDKMIHLIEQELVQADEAQTEAEFEKHMYAIHTLTSLYTSSDNQTSVQDRHDVSNAQALSSQRKESNQSNQSNHNENQVSAAEIEAMGGKVPQSMKNEHTSHSNLMTTDDNIGNGESIFDF
ncbi:DUF5327 family protein [Staphylococcus capitis]|uniref:DUF5327 family protein n=1 Tax=Staphylococcus capitis TaxID=29388 RepID=UPI000D1ACFCF|nr:DUF5327 family protein [Staphylococcus capitis]PTG25311.1 hypothetical protein BU628_07935 [Staphylococcus capitis]PTG30163.1 hypothetical protein BU630_07270 [Staphylococcus capitis]PTG37393.1 hypothetical protein BU624_07135 [Staphylococcus capitis]PTG98118.1 hypothetical protein BU625_06965 [Staphylococcus capitis]PTH04489.1 hypothetical protein BU621_07535 [Staphylococcus capitis]